MIINLIYKNYSQFNTVSYKERIIHEKKFNFLEQNFIIHIQKLSYVYVLTKKPFFKVNIWKIEFYVATHNLLNIKESKT